MAGAQYAGRSAQESKAMAYLDNAARFGRNMTSTGLETARLAGAQTAQAQGGVGGVQGAAGAGAAARTPHIGSATAIRRKINRVSMGISLLRYRMRHSHRRPRR